MSDERRIQSDAAPDAVDWSRVSDAERLRALADGELPAEVERELRAAGQTERLERAVAFERELRERVKGAMAGGSAPAGLRERIVEAAGVERAEAEVIRRPSRAFWSGGAGRWLALAAAIALAVSAFLVIPGPARGPGEGPPAVLARASEHISAEHRGCLSNPDYFSAKLAAPASAPARELIASQIGDLPIHLDLDREGYALAGLGACHLPGGGQSVHLLYEPADGAGEAVSLFIQQATEAHRGLVEGRVYSNGRAGPPMIRIWREGRVVYYVVTACPKACDAAEKAYALTGERTPL